MALLEQNNLRFTVKRLTRTRIIFALCVAGAADLGQVLLLPVAWTFLQSAVDVAAMILTTWLIGFHILLLPTFALEFIPGVDVWPTWTACVVAVIALRKRQERLASASSPKPPAVEI